MIVNVYSLLKACMLLLIAPELTSGHTIYYMTGNSQNPKSTQYGLADFTYMALSGAARSPHTYAKQAIDTKALLQIDGSLPKGATEPIENGLDDDNTSPYLDRLDITNDRLSSSTHDEHYKVENENVLDGDNTATYFQRLDITNDGLSSSTNDEQHKVENEFGNDWITNSKRNDLATLRRDCKKGHHFSLWLRKMCQKLLQT